MIKKTNQQNFVNAAQFGMLEKLEYSFFFGTISWTEKFCVLSNVGLLVFGESMETPTDLFPVLNCKVEKLQRTDDGFTADRHALKFVYGTKKIVFRFASKHD